MVAFGGIIESECFIPTRLIRDNILLAQEVMHSIGLGKNDWNVVLKRDMATAYDRVDWDFLQAMLARFPLWLRLIANCTQHCWFSVMVNGGLSGFFKSSRGLWQGDPLSLTLFVLASKYLSRGLSKLFDENRLLGFVGSYGVSHLAYVDDVLIFINSNEYSLSKVKDFLDDFTTTTDQSINIFKSSFLVAPKAPALIIQRIKRLMGFVHKPFPFTYFGPLIYVGRKKSVLFEPLIEVLASKAAVGKRRCFLSGVAFN
ncbi:UNVERIFIED_CONTAM: hypothetical protein Slati_3126900 [Sesamum latifolium]|uniref:Reverse transcriptase domain-containing protein n=1 Tax=Sesamum latifolium TaxID=2727402 RepID=A0AAW2UVU4_9LAMI